MLWNTKQRFHAWNFEKEAELESAIAMKVIDFFGNDTGAFLNQ
jgi:hypothetical protein